LQGYSYSQIAERIRCSPSQAHAYVVQTAKEVQAFEASLAAYTLEAASLRREMLLAQCLAELDLISIPEGAHDLRDLATLSQARALHLANAAKQLEALESMRGLHAKEQAPPAVSLTVVLNEGQGQGRGDLRLSELTDEQLSQVRRQLTDDFEGELVLQPGTAPQANTRRDDDRTAD